MAPQGEKNRRQFTERNGRKLEKANSRIVCVRMSAMSASASAVRRYFRRLTAPPRYAFLLRLIRARAERGGDFIDRARR